MPTLSGRYVSFSGRELTIDDSDALKLAQQDEQTTRLRANGEFWLCRDDGLLGKFGDPAKVVLTHAGAEYNVWVEPRGFSDGRPEYGLIVILPGGEYSNLFLAINAGSDALEIVDSWVEQAKFRCVE